MRHLRCWWSGCVPGDMQQVGDYDFVRPCKRCGAPDVSYSDMVGGTLKYRIKKWCRYWLFRKWFPAKCIDCGKRPRKPCPNCIPF